jgi:amino acid transporter
MSISDFFFGKPLATHEEGEQRVGVWAGIPMLGLDALASAAYGPEAALTVLLPLGALGLSYVLPITGVIIALLSVVYFSYRQTIAAYPKGGGSYTVARRNLGTFPGLLAAAALLLDYVMVVAIGISAGVGALVSVIPSLQPYILPLCLGILVLIALVNLRGVREAGAAFVAPTYSFVVALLIVLSIGLGKALLSGGTPAPVVSPPALLGTASPVSIFLLLHAFASGCTAMTGVEAISNGVGAFRQPSPAYARRTLTAVIAILIILLAGIAYLRVCTAWVRPSRAKRVTRVYCRSLSAQSSGKDSSTTSRSVRYLRFWPCRLTRALQISRACAACWPRMVFCHVLSPRADGGSFSHLASTA